MSMKNTSGTLPCIKTLRLLDDYLDGALDSGLSSQVELHIGACPPCRAEFQLLTAVTRAVERMDRYAPPPDLWQRVSLEIRQPAPARWRFPTVQSSAPMIGLTSLGRWRWPGAAMATAALAAAALALLWPHPPVPTDGSFPAFPATVSVQAIYAPRAPAGSRIEVASFMSQAEESSLFDPLANRPALSAAAAMSASATVPGASGSRPQVQVEDAMMTSGGGMMAQ